MCQRQLPKGLAHHSTRKTSIASAVAATVLREETDVEVLIQSLATDFIKKREFSANAVVLSTISRYASEHFVATGNLEEMDFLESVFAEALSTPRICYLTLPLSLSPEETVSITTQLKQKPSYDFGCAVTENKGLLGYDMVTSVGSALAFSEITATLKAWEHIEIATQNFGFDVEKGITKVSLDPKVQRYFLEIRSLE